jgi:hypothetical protein
MHLPCAVREIEVIRCHACRPYSLACGPPLVQRIALTPIRKLWVTWKMQALGRF